MQEGPDYIQLTGGESRYSSSKEDNVQVNTESVECISIACSEVRITEIREQLSRLDQSGCNENVYF